MKKSFVVSAALFLLASLVQAEPQKVLKVYILKMAKTADGKQAGPQVEMPTDQELSAAKKAIEKAGLQAEDLKASDRTIPLEMFLYQVHEIENLKLSKAGKKGKGLQVEKPTKEELAEQQKQWEAVKRMGQTIQRYELQFGLGPEIPLSSGLSTAYKTGFLFDLGLGYQFSDQFDLLLDCQFTEFQSNNPSYTGGYDFGLSGASLLVKTRFASEGVRPYLFAGPGIATGGFTGTIASGGLGGTAHLSGPANLSLLGGVGVEVPITPMTHLFIQTGLSYDFMGTDLVRFGSLDQSTSFLPITAGFVLGK